MNLSIFFSWFFLFVLGSSFIFEEQAFSMNRYSRRHHRSSRNRRSTNDRGDSEAFPAGKATSDKSIPMAGTTSEQLIDEAITSLENDPAYASAPWNKRMLETIKSTPLGGGYHSGGDTPKSYTFTNGVLHIPGDNNSQCNYSSYRATLETVIRDDAEKKKADPNYKGIFDRMSKEQLAQFEFPPKRDDVSFAGLWQNNFRGQADASTWAAAHESQFAKNFKDPKDALPGDAMMFDRTNGHGHSAIFLGWVTKKNGSKYMRFWSSNKGTRGYGIKEENVNHINWTETTFSRLYTPENLVDIPPLGTSAESEKGTKGKGKPPSLPNLLTEIKKSGGGYAKLLSANPKYDRAGVEHPNDPTAEGTFKFLLPPKDADDQVGEYYRAIAGTANSGSKGTEVILDYGSGDRQQKKGPYSSASSFYQQP